MNLTRGINLRKIAEMMPGASGAEVKVRNMLDICLLADGVNPNKPKAYIFILLIEDISSLGSIIEY